MAPRDLKPCFRCAVSCNTRSSQLYARSSRSRARATPKVSWVPSGRRWSDTITCCRAMTKLSNARSKKRTSSAALGSSGIRRALPRLGSPAKRRNLDAGPRAAASSSAISTGHLQPPRQRVSPFRDRYLQQFAQARNAVRRLSERPAALVRQRERQRRIIISPTRRG